jgi:hypothetical protein
MVKKTAEVQAEAVKEAEEAAKTSGTGSPAREPEKSKMPEPGLTEDTAQIINTDQAHSLNPNVTVSGTKPVGDGTYALLDTVDPAVANAALLPPRVHKQPENPSLPPEFEGKPPAEGEVRFKCTADNEPFYHGGPMKKDEVYTMSKEEADLLVQTKAGNIEGGGAPAARDDNARPDGGDVV